jgi:hypothetical protein
MKFRLLALFSVFFLTFSPIAHSLTLAPQIAQDKESGYDRKI